jgi:hypothetical protein
VVHARDETAISSQLSFTLAFSAVTRMHRATLHDGNVSGHPIVPFLIDEPDNLFAGQIAAGSQMTA